MTRVYYKEAVAAIVVFDITNRKTFGAVDAWLKDVHDKLDLETGTSIPILLLANKTDLLKEKSACVEDGELEQYVAANGLIGSYRTSAKENDSISDAMKFLVGHLREADKAKSVAPVPAAAPQNDTFTLHSGPAPASQQSTGGPPCCRN